MQNPEKGISSKRVVSTIFSTSFPLNYDVALRARTVERPHQTTVVSLSFDTVESDV